MAEIRRAALRDIDAIARIYNHYVINDISTFEETSVSVDEIWSRISAVDAESYPWLVYEQVGLAVGYSYASQLHSRSGFRFTAESSVYIDPEYRSQGIGGKLYAELLLRLSAMKLHTVIAGISVPNASSVSLHKKFGFAKVAHFSEVGFKFNRWIDLENWQLAL